MNEINKKQREYLVYFNGVKDNLWRFCLSITASRYTAEDVLSQTILESFAGFDRLRNKAAFRSWIFTIAKRISIKYYKESSRLAPMPDEVCELLAADLIDEDFEEVTALYRAIAELPENQKEAIVLFEINGLSRAEVAEIQHSNIETVKKRLAAARKKLKEMLYSVSKHGQMV